MSRFIYNFLQIPIDDGSVTADGDAVAVSGAQNRYDDCSGVQCPELDCPTRPYIPRGECCPVCPGR